MFRRNISSVENCVHVRRSMGTHGAFLLSVFMIYA